MKRDTLAKVKADNAFLRDKAKGQGRTSPTERHGQYESLRPAVAVLASQGLGAPAIHEAFQELFSKGKLLVESVPSTKTIRRMIMGGSAPAPREAPWSLATADGDEAALVLPVTADLLYYSDGHITTIGLRHAGWLVRVLRAVPSLDSWTAYTFSAYYLIREDVGAPAADLDALLGYLAKTAPAAEGESYDEKQALRTKTHDFLRTITKVWPGWAQPDVWSHLGIPAIPGPRPSTPEEWAARSQTGEHSRAAPASRHRQQNQEVQDEQKG